MQGMKGLSTGLPVSSSICGGADPDLLSGASKLSEPTRVWRRGWWNLADSLV